MSARTRGVAVAVSARQTACGKRLRTSASWRYSGRKSWPHSEMQWASSMVNRATFTLESKAKQARGQQRFRGHVEQAHAAIPHTRHILLVLPPASSVLLRNKAGTPAARSCSTWSFIKAISGETTTVRPSNRSAGIW